MSYGVDSVTIVTAGGGLRFTAEIRGHRVATDQPVAAGGDDAAATPLELLSASLGTCIALYAHQFCAARGLPHAGLLVEVRAEPARAPYRIGRFGVRVVLPGELPAEYRPALERAVRTCPVHNTLSDPPAIDVDIVEPAAE
jgi:putative redox protein